MFKKHKEKKKQQAAAERARVVDNLVRENGYESDITAALTIEDPVAKIEALQKINDSITASLHQEYRYAGDKARQASKKSNRASVATLSVGAVMGLTGSAMMLTGFLAPVGLAVGLAGLGLECGGTTFFEKKADEKYGQVSWTLQDIRNEREKRMKDQKKRIDAAIADITQKNIGTIETSPLREKILQGTAARVFNEAVTGRPPRNAPAPKTPRPPAAPQ